MNARLWSHVQVAEGDACWEWQGRKCCQGYGRLDVGGASHLAHRLVYEDVYGPIPEGLCVCHHCDNPSCVRPDHLFLGTKTDNMVDKVLKGRQLRGEKIPQSKLTAGKVIEMRRQYRAGIAGASALAREYGVSRDAVYQMLRRETWGWVQEPEEAACL